MADRFDPENPGYGHEYSNAPENLPPAEPTPVPPQNNIPIQPWSEKNEDNTVKQVPKETYGKTQSTGGNLLTKVIAGMGAAAGALIIVIGLWVNNIPAVSDLRIEALADRIDIAYTVSYIEGYSYYTSLTGTGTDNTDKTDEYTSAENGAESQKPIDVSQSFQGLSPDSSYKYTLTAKSGNGETVLLSRTIRTPGYEPEASVWTAEFIAAGNGETDIYVTYGISDPGGYVTKADLLWEDSAAGISGTVNADITGRTAVIKNYTGSGNVTFRLYCTAKGDRRLYDTFRYSVTAEPQLSVELLSVPDGLCASLTALIPGGVLKSAHITAAEYGLDVTLDAQQAPGWSYIFPYMGSAKAGKVRCTAVFSLGGRTFVREAEAVIAFPDISGYAGLSLAKVTDSGTSVQLQFTCPDISDGGNVTRTDVLMDDGRITFKAEGAVLPGTVVLSGLSAGCEYELSVRLYSGDVYTEMHFGSITTDRNAVVSAGFIRSDGEIRFRIISDDSYGYYSGYSAYIADGSTSVQFEYDAQSDTYYIPAGGFTEGAVYDFALLADSSKPSDKAAGTVRVTLYSCNIVY